MSVQIENDVVFSWKKNCRWWELAPPNSGNNFFLIMVDLRRCTDDICATSRYLGNGYLAGMLKNVESVTGFIIDYWWYRGLSFNV